MVKDNHSFENESLHVQMKQIIRAYINEHQPEYLPSERTFQRKFNVSRTTLRKALKDLESEKRIIAVHGKGYRVLMNKTTENLSGKIGIAVRNNSPEYEVSVSNHIIDQIYNIGFQPVITVVDSRYELASEKLAKLASEVDGMIVLSSLLLLDGVKEALSDAPYRCIAAPYKIPDELGFSSVSAEIFNSYKTIVDYLISKGHRKIIMLTDERDTAKFAGVEESFKEHGIDFSSVALFHCRGYRHCGYERFGELLKDGTDFTAVVCQNDSCALGVIERCMKERLDVPGNISIVGFDNIPDSARFPVPLTTAGIDLKQMSKVIIHRLFEGIRTEKVQFDVEINTQFIERESVRQL